MKEEKVGSRRVGTLFRGGALALAVLAAESAAAQMEIDDLIITAGPAYFNGVFSDFFIDPVIFGSEIAAVSVTIQSGAEIDFIEEQADILVIGMGMLIRQRGCGGPSANQRTGIPTTYPAPVSRPPARWPDRHL